MLNIKSSNQNYLARVFVLPELKTHPNADRLAVCNYLGNSIITSKSAKVGEIYIFCPLESKLNEDFLSFTNSFSDSTLNKDNTKKGFFGNTGRVRATSLRGQKSEGYIFPAAELSKWLESTGVKYTFTDKDVEKDFDSIGEVLFIEKYINKQAIIDAQKAAKQGKIGKKARESKIIDGQYHLAMDTEALKRNMDKISPDDEITISYKMHGANFSAGRVLCKKPLKWYEKIFKKIGLNIVDTHYDLVYASRRVIKNSYADKETNHYYNEDIWGVVANQYKDSILNGITIHGEIVNQLSNGSWIQKNYDYGIAPNKVELFVYRIFYTNPDGKVFEFNTDQIVEYCNKYGLKTTPIFYTGTVREFIWKNKDKFSFYDGEYFESGWENGREWRDEFLELLKQKYTEKKCYMCVNDVPEEGIVLIKNAKNRFEAYKLKSFRFLERETAELDKGEANIEDVESATI